MEGKVSSQPFPKKFLKHQNHLFHCHLLVNVIHRVMLGEESSNHLLEIFEENVEIDENENGEELVCEGIPQLDDYKVPIPFPEALYSKTMLNSMNLEREYKIS